MQKEAGFRVAAFGRPFSPKPSLQDFQTKTTQLVPPLLPPQINSITSIHPPAPAAQ
jgi:hypothetical protein